MLNKLLEKNNIDEKILATNLKNNEYNDYIELSYDFYIWFGEDFFNFWWDNNKIKYNNYENY